MILDNGNDDPNILRSCLTLRWCRIQQLCKVIECCQQVRIKAIMSTDLASFLAPGSLLSGVTQRITEFLSVQDLLKYVASSGTHDASSLELSASAASASPGRKGAAPFEASAGGHTGKYNGERSLADSRSQPAAVCCGDGSYQGNWQDMSSREEEIAQGPGAGDEAGGVTRKVRLRNSVPYNHSATESPPLGQGRCGPVASSSIKGSVGGRDRRRHHHKQQQRRQQTPGMGIAAGGGVGVSRGSRHEEQKRGEREQHQENKFGIFGVLLGLGLHPFAAIGMIGGGVSHGVSHFLGQMPLLALLRWAAGGAEMVLGVTFRVALLPYDVTRGVVSYVVGTLEAMLNVATEIWIELRHLSLAELACVVSCVVSGNPIPECLLPPLDATSGDYGCGGSGFSSGTNRFHGSLSSPTEFGSGESTGQASGPRFTSELSQGGERSGASSMYSDECRSTAGGSRGAWRQAHAMRRRLDRVNRTASLVSYEEWSQSAVPRAKAQRVRRRMHYAMSLQCFQATVTVGGRSSPDGDDYCEGDEGGSGGDSRGGAGRGSADPFMCTPQSFPPTPISRANVMARTSQFADDILFLARDQLRLGENLKPGVDETTRATADFLKRQQRLAVLDGNNACEGISLTCGHHCATKIGTSLYSSVRAMVPVLRNRHVYFQVSCTRNGALAPCIGVGLSTPEMPLSTLVGAFSNSVGLCSTGQILMSSRWYGMPGEYAVQKSVVSTVGVLVYLDGSRSFRSWDGDMVRALVCFSVDGRLVRITSGGAATSTQHLSQQQHQALATAGDSSHGVLRSNVMINTNSVSQGMVSNSVRNAGTSNANTSFVETQDLITQSSAAVLPPHQTLVTAVQQQQQQQQQPCALASASSVTTVAPAVLSSSLSPSSIESVGGLAPGLAAGPTSSNLNPFTPMDVVPNPPSAEEVAPWEPGAIAAAPFVPVASLWTMGCGGVGGVAGVGRGVMNPGTGVPEGGVAGACESATAALGLALPKDRDLFPTVTIHSSNTETLCRFCAEDLVPVTRESIGAPPAVPVYALDGSLINLP